MYVIIPDDDEFRRFKRSSDQSARNKRKDRSVKIEHTFAFQNGTNMKGLKLNDTALTREGTTTEEYESEGLPNYVTQIVLPVVASLLVLSVCIICFLCFCCRKSQDDDREDAERKAAPVVPKVLPTETAPVTLKPGTPKPARIIIPTSTTVLCDPVKTQKVTVRKSKPNIGISKPLRPKSGTEV